MYLKQSFLLRLADDLDMKVLNFDNFGKEFIKSQKMSPDSFVQMAIQLSFYKMYKTPSATYESGTTNILSIVLYTDLLTIIQQKYIIPYL